jgi:hypothetical protein
MMYIKIKVQKENTTKLCYTSLLKTALKIKQMKSLYAAKKSNSKLFYYYMVLKFYHFDTF